jgi:hypothetical protein
MCAEELNAASLHCLSLCSTLVAWPGGGCAQNLGQSVNQSAGQSVGVRVTVTVIEGNEDKELRKGSESVGVAMAEFGLDWRSKANKQPPHT